MNHGQDQEPSFDPRSWVTRPAPPDRPQAEPQRAPAPASPVSSRPVAPHPVSSHPVLPHAVGAAIALTAALFAYASRPSEPLRDVAPTGAPAPPPGVAAAPGLETRALVVPGLSDIGPSLLSLGVAPADAAEAARLAAARLGRTEGEVRLEAALAPRGAGGQLHSLLATRTDGSGAAIRRAGGSLVATAVSARLERRLRFVRGELDGQSFYSSAVAAGVEDVLVGDFANAFRYDFDMQREVAPGDVFEAGFEQRVTPDGTPVGAPTLVYASLATTAKSRALYRYQAAATAEAEWFDSSGRSSRRALMRTPVEAARISSGFGMRGHPILGFVKMHRGTDFAAPTGTPIFAAGDAVVAFAAPKGPNGNFVRLRHDNGWETLYLHMNRFAPGIAPGVRVVQGQQLGEVGTTGRSTGPHLHYEVHIAGNPVDPMSIDTGGGRALSGAALARFRRTRDAIDADRATTA